MAYYSCTTIGCSLTTTVTPYTSEALCKAACVGWGCGPSPDLAPDADILFVFDASGSLPTATLVDYFHATTAWTQTLTQNGWTGDANWASSMDLSGSVDFYPSDGGGTANTTFALEEWLSWGAIPYAMTNLKPDGSKDFVAPGTNVFPPGAGWIYIVNLPGGNPDFISVLPGADQYFTKYTARPNTINTGFTYPINDQLVITFSDDNAGYVTYNNGYGVDHQNNEQPTNKYVNDIRLWNTIWDNKPADRNYKAWAIPAVYEELCAPPHSGTKQQNSFNGQRHMLMAIDSGNQDDTDIGGTGTLDGTWVVIPNGGTNLDGTTCTNVNGCSTIPGGEGSANPCIYNGYNGSPSSPGPGGTHDPTITFNPCYTYSHITGDVDANFNGSINTLYTSQWSGLIGSPPTGFGGLDKKGWSHRAYDNTFNNPQNDIAALLDNEILSGGAANWVPVDCFSAETNYSLSITHPYSSYANCLPCTAQWYCDGLGTPCYSAYTSGGPNWYANEVLCQANCNITIPYWSCTTEGCVSGYTVTPHTTKLDCQEDCVGWGCTAIVTELSADIFVFYDTSSMGDTQVNEAYYGVTQYLASLAAFGSVTHILEHNEQWLKWPGYVMDGDSVKEHPGTNAAGVSLYPGNLGNNITIPARALSDNTLILTFIDESSSQYYRSNIDGTGVNPLNTSGGYNGYANLMGDRTDYLTLWDDVIANSGTLDCYMYPTTTSSAASGSRYWFAHHSVAIIHPGNNSPLDGKWQPGTAPRKAGSGGVAGGVPDLCKNYDLTLLETVNPYWDGTGPTRADLNNHGWVINYQYPSLNAQTMSNDLTTYINNNSSVSTVTSNICTSAETDYLLSITHSSATEAQCWVDCSVTGFTCTPIGCNYGFGPNFPYDSLAKCESACTSYNCSSTGCTLYNEPGTSDYTGSGNLGTGGTHESLTICLNTACVSYDCTASGCTQYNISAGTPSYLNGSGGTGGTYFTSSCDDLCSSFDCTTTGCTDYNISAGTSSYALFDGSPMQGDGGTGGTYASTVICSAVCISYECTDYGCVIYNDPETDWSPGYTNGHFGSGGTFSTLNSCTAACQSFGCEEAGCESWNASNVSSDSYQYAEAVYDLGGNYGTGGSATLALCTGQCFTWECDTNGCISTVGDNPNAYAWDLSATCNSFCTSHNCTTGGCVAHNGGLGSGGTYTGNTSLQDCQSGTATLPACIHWECDPLTNSVHPNSAFSTWDYDPCTQKVGSGGTFSSLNDCQTGCTSWSCQYEGNYYEYPNGNAVVTPNGCLQFSNTGSSTSQLTYNACTAQTVCERYDCTDTGCVVGDHVTGMYDSYNDCTGGTATLQACQSMSCGPSGSYVYNSPGNPVGLVIPPGYGTGGTWTGADMLLSASTYCKAYNCTNIGCTEQTGWNGMYYDPNDPSNAAAMCQAACISYVCLDSVPDGVGNPSPCVIYNSIPGTPGYSNGFSGSGGTFDSMYSCGTDCISWNCTNDGCISQLGTGGTFTTKAACTGSCQSFACATTGCTGYNDPLYPNSPGYTDGEYGTGGTYTLSAACTASCVSYNCTDTGCVVTGGTQGMYADLPTCNTACSSWDCLSSGCTEYNISAGTPSYTTGSGGTGGTYFNSSCDNECSSFDCTSTGCTEYNVISGTASYGLFNGTVYQGHGGTGGTYTGASCDNFCYSYECVDIETTSLNWGWNDDGCIQQIGTGSTFYSGIVSLVGVQNSYTACTAQCRSWSCVYPSALSDGCVEFPNTGNSQTFLSLNTCTADTQCERYDCTDYGCVPGNHITGTYDDLPTCEAACTSYECDDDGCNIWNDIGTGTYTQSPGGGTGGTFTTSNCDQLCSSYNCVVSNLYSFDACQLQPGSGGTFFNIVGQISSLDECQTGCTAWSCENPNAISYGCLNYPNTGSTVQIMYDSYSACTAQTICERYDCTPDGCVIGSQVTGDFASFDECTGGTVANNNTDACQSWNCTSSGTSSGVPCEVFNGPNSIGINENGTLNYVIGANYGTYGTGGINQTSLANCNVHCKSWNCEDTGCNQQIGYGGAYDDSTCSVTGGVYNICYSYECNPFTGSWEDDACSQYDGSGSTFFNAGGTVLSLADCQSACTSWSCQNPGPVVSIGCLEYPNTGNTLSQSSYTACTADTVCWRYDCTAAGCVVGSQTGGTYSSLNDCITGTTVKPACQSWQCANDGCEEFNSPSYPVSPFYTDGTYGTGGTNMVGLVDCNLNCRSYECEDYGCEDYGGTGHTYISTVAINEYSVWLNCVDNCKSWDCVDVGTNIYINGCQTYNNSITDFVGFGTGGTYTASTCDSACTSYNCVDMGTHGCTEMPNTASTYNSYNSCTANTECKHYDCTVSGCIEILSVYQGGVDSYETMDACTGSCIGWSCTRDIIQTGTSIYVYYDISNLSFGNILNQRIHLQNYIDSNYATFAGQIYHTIVSDGRWLDWANSIYSGEFSVAPGTGVLPWEPTSFHDERALLGIKEIGALPASGWLSSDWYDQYSAGTYVHIGINSVTLPGGQIKELTTRGIAPTANTSNDVIVINFITEADGIEDNTTLNVVSSTHGYHDSIMPSTWLGLPFMLNQPMTEWKQDYTAYTQNYNTVSGDSGTIRALLYPVRVAGSATVFNPQSTKMCLLQSLASISSGNQTVSDGTWLQNTAPTTPGNGGVTGGVPELCYAVLSQLESVNPYWTNTTPTWGGLDMSGWTVNIAGSYIGATNYTGFLDDYLLVSTTGLTAGTCTSAETLYTVNVAYSYSSETECDTACEPTMYICTTTGCTLSWDGYLTLVQCGNKCKSVSCTDTGCEYYNNPTNTSSSNWSNGNYGSGGTWTGGMGTGMMADCSRVCMSTNCNGYPNNLLQQGCVQQNGTGGTWTGIDSYSACTGSCMSWSCDDPCQKGGVGCIEYPNTGATYSALTACTATCQENYYCITGLTTDTCSGLIDSTITSSTVTDHVDIIQDTSSWQNINFNNFKFIQTNVILLPTDINVCYDIANNGYWTKVISITVVVTVGGAIPTTYTFLDWNDLFNVMNNQVLLTPMTEISDIMNLSGVDVTINTEFCICDSSDCAIGCTNTSSLPANSTGFYETYLSAQTDCCPVTSWVCSANTIVDNCDALTLIPGLYSAPELCFQYLNMYYGLPAMDFTNFKCEIPPINNTIMADCEIGPNYGQLIKLTGITVNIPAISSNVYTSWSGLTYALQTTLNPAVPGVVTGMTTLVTWLLTQQIYPGAEFTYGWTDCECDNPYTCECIEISGSSGTYSSQTLCVAECCTATTWNCVQDQPYLPICQQKQWLGVGTSELQILDYYRLNSPTTIFGFKKCTISSDPLIPQSEVNSNMGGSGNGDFCYQHVGNNFYRAYKYLYGVSHPLINGGTMYQTWDKFFSAVDLVVTACTNLDTATVVNGKINAFFGQTIFELDLDFKSCCDPSSCYCYDTLTTGGSYNSETLCDDGCCPDDTASWACVKTAGSYDVCIYGNYGTPLNSTVPSNGPWATWSECNQLSIVCAKSWRCSMSIAPITTPPTPCFEQPCIEWPGHYDYQPPGFVGYPTEYSCNTNTDLDCCGPEALWVCMSSETVTTMSGLTIVPDNFGTLGYHSSDQVLTYLSDPTASPTRQYSGITAFTFCRFESGTTALSVAEESCKCGDGCDGILHSTNYIVFNNLLTGYGSNALPYHPSTNPEGYCTNWADMIAQLNNVWDPTNTLNVNLNMTFHDVVTATTSVIGNIITISISGLESCVDNTGPCDCEPCYTPNCGMEKSICESVCCQPIPTTWTCTPNGCLDVCNGKGEFQTETECKLVCYEWGCMDDVWGCTDTGATNYNVLATIDDGSCVYATDRWSCKNVPLIDGCASRTHVFGGLSFTAAIYGITGAWMTSGIAHHTAEFSTLKFDLGGGNNHMTSTEDRNHQLPYGLGGEPCPLPCPPGMTDCVDGFASWGQPGPYMAYIKYLMYSGLPGIQYTTWASFITAINTLGYTFTTYFTPGTSGNNGGTSGWQDLEAVLGASQLHCEWTWCNCGTGCNCVPDANGPYLNESQCDSDTNNCCESWNCETTYVTNTCGNNTDIGFTTSVLYPQEALGFMVNNGYQNTDVSTLKFIFSNPVHLGFCPIDNNTQHWASYVDISVGNGTLATLVQTWDDAITWINANTSLVLTITMTYQSVMNIINVSSVYIFPNLYICECTGVDCGCVELFDGSGKYSTSGDCANSPTSCCYVPDVSYDCVTTIASDSCAGNIDSGHVFISTQLYFDHLNVNFGANADVGDYKYHEPCSTGGGNAIASHCPVPNQPGMCYAKRIYWRTSYFGNPTNLGGGVTSPYFYTFQQIVDWFNLVATTEGYAGGFNASMTIDDMITLAVSQNTYTTQDYCNAGVTTPWGCNSQVPPNMGSTGGGAGCGCVEGGSSCIDPGDGSGEYETDDECKFHCHGPCGQHQMGPWSITNGNTPPGLPQEGNCECISGYGPWIPVTPWPYPNAPANPYHFLNSMIFGGQVTFAAPLPAPHPVGNYYNNSVLTDTMDYLYNNQNQPMGRVYLEVPGHPNLIMPNSYPKHCCGIVNGCTHHLQYMTGIRAYVNRVWDPVTVQYLPAPPFAVFGASFIAPYEVCTWRTWVDDINANLLGITFPGPNALFPVSYSDNFSQIITKLNQAGAGTGGGYAQYGSQSCRCTDFNGDCDGSPLHIPDNNFEQYLETHSRHTTPGTAYNGVTVAVGDVNSMGNGVAGDNIININRICDVTKLSINNKGISDLNGIYAFAKLEGLDCWGNQLTKLDVSHNLYLEELRCYENQITSNVANPSLELSGLPFLRILLCYDNLLPRIDVSNNPLLVELMVDDNDQIPTLDVSNNPLLTKLGFALNSISTIDLSNNVLLNWLSTGGNPLGSLDVSMLPNLKNLYCSDNLLPTIDVSNNLLLYNIDCSSTGLNSNTFTTLDVSVNVNLVWLNCLGDGSGGLQHLYLGSVLDLVGLNLTVQYNPNLTIHVGTPQRIVDMNNIFTPGVNYDVGTIVTI